MQLASLLERMKMVAVSLNRNDSPIHVILRSSCFVNNDDDGGSVFFLRVMDLWKIIRITETDAFLILL